MNYYFGQSLLDGDFGVARQCCLSLTYGEFWTRWSDEFDVYWRSQSATFDYLAAPVAQSDDVDATVAIATQALDDDTWYYVSRSFGLCGAISSPSSTLIVTVNAAGAMDIPVGNLPSKVQVDPATGGAVQVMWAYSSTHEPARPTGFKIYRSDVLQDTIAFHRGQAIYKWTSTTTYTHEDTETFEVRTYRTSGATTNESDGVSDSCIIDAIGPIAVTGITVSLT